MPLQLSLWEHQNQSTKAMTLSNAGSTTGPVLGMVLPNRMLRLQPPGASPPAPVPDMINASFEELERKHVAQRVHQNFSARGTSQDHSKKSCPIKSVRRLLALLVLVCFVDGF